VQFTKNGPLTVTGFNKPATECGGDWWGTFQVGSDIQYVFIADAMGHGVPAALVTTMAYACCGTLVSMVKEQGDIKELASPAAILTKFNDVLYQAVKGRISITFFALMIDHNKGIIRFANGGHNPPLLIPLNADDDRLTAKSKKNTTMTLRAEGNILGVGPSEKFTERELELRPGDKIFLYTDGLIEGKDPQGSAWGQRTLSHKLTALADKRAEELGTTLINDAYRFFDGVPQDDDITVVVVEIAPEHAFMKGTPAEPQKIAVNSN
jgi:sigma-B regulation protein RsbU (phosphoserine phosphatase)